MKPEGIIVSNESGPYLLLKYADYFNGSREVILSLIPKSEDEPCFPLKEADIDALIVALKQAKQWLAGGERKGILHAEQHPLEALKSKCTTK